jgi:hypothetical protein
MFEIQDEHRSNLLREWYDLRKERLLGVLRVSDILIGHGVNLRGGGFKREQLACPFHGIDRKPSARYYPEGVESRAGLWCWVCRERWDALSLWGKFHNFEGSFGQLLKSIEIAYGIETPEYPKELREVREDPSIKEIARLVEVLEHRLKNARDELGMVDYLRFSVALDRIVVGGLGVECLRDLLNEVGEKCRVV